MRKSNICILGNGLLGSELHRQTGWDMISRSVDGFDITKPDHWDDYLYEREHGTVMYKKYHTIVNCIACTDTYSDDRQKHWDVNYVGVVELTDYCLREGIKLVHISTDYVYSQTRKANASEDDVPVHCENWYGYTKLLGDAYVQLRSSDNLIIRSTHKAEPFPYPGAWSFQRGNFDYVSIIANLIVRVINRNGTGVFNVGTHVKTMYELALETNQTVFPLDLFDSTVHESTPKDVTMNVEKMQEFIKNVYISPGIFTREFT